MLLTPEKITQRKYRLMSSAEKLESYRAIRLVNRAVVYGDGDGYPLCPRCESAIEREYIRFCCRCGQHLGWSIYRPPTTDMPGTWRACK